MELYIDALNISQYGFSEGVFELEKNNVNALKNVFSVVNSVIDAYTGRTFCKESKLITLDGDGTNLLRLDDKAISIDYITLDPDTRPILLNSEQYSIRNNGTVVILKNGATFPDGVSNILVEGVFGYEEVPDDVITAFVTLTNSYYDILTNSEVLSQIAGPFQAEKIGNYSYAIKSGLEEIAGDPTSTTGVPLVDKILDKYRKKISIGVV